MSTKVPIEVVRGVEEVTVWMWPAEPDPLTVRFTHHEWAQIERKAEQVAGGDIELVIGQLLENDLSQYPE